MPPEITSMGLSKVAEGFAKELFESAKGVAAKSIGKLQAEFGVGFEKYVQRNQNKCRFVKTLLHRIDPIPIEQAYVEPSLKIEKEVILGSLFPEKLNKLKNVIIVGNGGSGKSMFMKKLFLDLCEYSFGRIPLFIELRDLNSRDDKNLLKLIHHQWSELIPSFKLEAVEAGFRSGKFVLLLDGLDEVDKQERDKVSKNIIELSYKFPLCPIVLTSRPISDFSAWQEFYTAEIQPFDLPRVLELVEKTSIDRVIKSNFLSEVKERLFRSHQTFLANPLLCTMMILTYTEFEEIPSKMHIFYARAFDVLFTRHDKTKTFFNRKFYTTLAEDDFKRLFSTFCLFSYLESAYSFDRGAALDFLKLTFEFESSAISPSDFLSDMHESISILVKDGDTFSFLHRSFQEYFSAVFLAERQLPEMDRLFDKILENDAGNNVLNLLFEMNQDALESKFLIKKVRQFRNELIKLNPKRHLPQLLAMIFEDVAVPEFDTSSWSLGRRHHFLELLSHFYGLSSPDKLFFDFVSPIDWAELLGITDPKKNTKVLLISNAKIAETPFAKNLTRFRSEIIELDKNFRKKDKNRDGFILRILKKKS
jgi:NACHT domain